MVVVVSVVMTRRPRFELTLAVMAAVLFPVRMGHRIPAELPEVAAARRLGSKSSAGTPLLTGCVWTRCPRGALLTASLVP